MQSNNFSKFLQFGKLIAYLSVLELAIHSKPIALLTSISLKASTIDTFYV